MKDQQEIGGFDNHHGEDAVVVMKLPDNIDPIGKTDEQLLEEVQRKKPHWFGDGRTVLLIGSVIAGTVAVVVGTIVAVERYKKHQEQQEQSFQKRKPVSERVKKLLELR